MRLSFTPVQTSVGEAAAHRSHRVQIDPKGMESLRSSGSKVVGVTVAGGFAAQPSHGSKTIVERDAQGPGHVIVASPRSQQPAWGAGHEFGPRAAGDYVQSLERVGNVGAFQAVVTMFPLREHCYQVF